NQSEKTLRIGSRIRARITAISLGKSTSMGKIGITCRQPFLGALDWIEREIKRAQETRTDTNDTPTSKSNKTLSSSNIISPNTKKDKK
ncbi:MAG: DNA-directed RNA polymerase, partial [Candidatus Nitrosocosmicus sp.]